jgi:hypothetical protein
MKAKNRRPKKKAAFVLEDGDRFHSIWVSDGIRYKVEDDVETVITFFVIARADGTFEIVQIMKTFKGQDCISRGVQKKKGIPADRLKTEIANIEWVFGVGIEKMTGFRIKWHRIDLSKIENPVEQVAKIKAWGRVGAWTAWRGRRGDLP